MDREISGANQVSSLEVHEKEDLQSNDLLQKVRQRVQCASQEYPCRYQQTEDLTKPSYQGQSHQKSAKNSFFSHVILRGLGILNYKSILIRFQISDVIAFCMSSTVVVGMRVYYKIKILVAIALY